MLRKTIALSLLVGALAACGEPRPDPEAADQIGPVEEIARSLPEEDSEPRFLGRWATSQDYCNQYDWYFMRDRISTPGEVSCAFDTVQETDSGYTISAICTAEGPPEHFDIQLAFAESAQAMLLTGGPWSGPQTGLVYCGPAEPGATGATSVGVERD